MNECQYIECACDDHPRLHKLTVDGNHYKCNNCSDYKSVDEIRKSGGEGKD